MACIYGSIVPDLKERYNCTSYTLPLWCICLLRIQVFIKLQVIMDRHSCLTKKIAAANRAIFVIGKAGPLISGERKGVFTIIIASRFHLGATCVALL